MKMEEFQVPSGKTNSSLAGISSHFQEENTSTQFGSIFQPAMLGDPGSCIRHGKADPGLTAFKLRLRPVFFQAVCSPDYLEAQKGCDFLSSTPFRKIKVDKVAFQHFTSPICSFFVFFSLRFFSPTKKEGRRKLRGHTKKSQNKSWKFMTQPGMLPT